MTERKKIVLYLQRLIQEHADITSAMLSVAGFSFAPGVAYMPAAYQPRERSIMGFSSACDGLDSGKWHAAFFVPKSLIYHTMKNTKKTAGETANPITFMPEWLDFTQHLSNAQVGRLLRCVARYERGDINTEHVAELHKDAAVGVAYNFITDQMERRTRS